MVQHSMDTREEAERLNRLFGPQQSALFQFLSGQLGIIKGQSQMLMGLCGLAITVTGFSGAHMIRAGSGASFLLALGILHLLGGALLCLNILTKIRWVSQDLSDDFVQTTYVVILRRNHQQAQLFRAGILVSFGLAFYLSAVIVAALTPR